MREFQLQTAPGNAAEVLPHVEREHDFAGCIACRPVRVQSDGSGGGSGGGGSSSSSSSSIPGVVFARLRCVGPVFELQGNIQICNVLFE